MNTTQNLLTAEDIDRCAADDRWLGWGYIQGRNYAERTTAADALVLRYAHELGWDYEDLFAWSNSKDGRWFADWAFGCDDPTIPAWMPRLFPERPAR